MDRAQSILIVKTLLTLLKYFMFLAFVAAILVGPRVGRWDKGTDSLPMGSPTTVVLGTFMLWWGWLGFNCGRYVTMILNIS